VAGFCEHGDEPSGSVKKRGIFNELSNNQLFKLYPAPWSKSVSEMCVRQKDMQQLSHECQNLALSKWKLLLKS
jgi:hypothetical protein